MTFRIRKNTKGTSEPKTTYFYGEVEDPRFHRRDVYNLDKLSPEVVSKMLLDVSKALDKQYDTITHFNYSHGTATIVGYAITLLGERCAIFNYNGKYYLSDVDLGAGKGPYIGGAAMLTGTNVPACLTNFNKMIVETYDGLEILEQVIFYTDGSWVVTNMREIFGL